MDRLVNMPKPMTMRIGSKTIGEGSPCFIIAEAGVNHNRRLDFAKKLIDAAAKAGADAVKFQTYRTRDLILSDIGKASYQKKTTPAGESQTEMLKKLEIGRDFHRALIQHCAAKKIIFMSTCYEQKSLDLLVGLGVVAIKIASTDTTNYLFLEQVAKTGKPVIVSTGMSCASEIEQACQCLRKNGCRELALLKCTSNYPTGLDEVNLRAMATLGTTFDALVGFSDHTPGIGASPYAVALGARIVEKHFTLDKNLSGPDHQASLSPQELLQWVREIRKVEAMLGSSALGPTAGEQETKKVLQKHLVSKTRLKKGDRITRDHVVAKRTGGQGVPASAAYELIGLTLVRDLPADWPVCWPDVGK